MKIDLWPLAVIVFISWLAYEEITDKDRCFEAMKAHIELKGCNQ